MILREMNTAGDPIVSSLGVPLAGCTITLRLVDRFGSPRAAYDRYTGELIESEPVVAATDGAGEFTISAWPTDRSVEKVQYRCRIRTLQGKILDDFCAQFPQGSLEPLAFASFRIIDDDLLPAELTAFQQHLANHQSNLWYLGTWDAATNTPPIPPALPENNGDWYKVGVPGNTNIDGITDWQLDDSLISNGSVWTQMVSPFRGLLTDLYNISQGGNVNSHYHDADRVRANHTGQQAPETIRETSNKRFVTDQDMSRWDSAISGVTFMGLWDADLNLPPIPTASSANRGWFYKVNVAGNTDINGNTVWLIGDEVYSNGTVWQRVEPGDAPAFHAENHLTEGMDPLPLATELTDGLMPANTMAMLGRYAPTAIYIQEAQPNPMPVGTVWFSMGERVSMPPAIVQIWPQYVLTDTVLAIPLYLSDLYNVSEVTLQRASSDTAKLPLTDIVLSGAGGERLITIAGGADPYLAPVTVTITATNHDGLSATMAFTYQRVALAYAITATDGEFGTISPKGVITVPQGGAITFTGIPDQGYGVNTVAIDGGGAVAAESWTFTNVQANHSIDMQFTNAYTITASAGANGTISPVGAVGVVAGRDRTFTITPNGGSQINTLTVDGQTVATAGSYTFEDVAADHTIAATFIVVSQLAQVSGVAVTVLSGTALRISWSDITGETGYFIYWSADPGDTTGSAIIARGNSPLTAAADATQVDHTGLDNGTVYRYTVVAENDFYASTPSAVVAGQPNVAPTSSVVATLLTPPYITGIVPTAGATGVATNATVTVTFSENMDFATASGNFVVYSDASRTTEKTGSLAEISATEWRFTPTTSYSAATTYYPCVKVDARDATGAGVRAQVNWEFRTA